MKIILLVNSYLPRIGGRELVVHQLAQQYKNKGHEVCVMGPSGPWKYRQYKFDYPVIRWPQIPLLGDERSKTLMMNVTRLFKGADIIHAHSTFPMGYIAEQTNWIRPMPVVITPHGEDINVIPEIGFGQRLDPEQDRKIRSALQHSAKVTSISDTITESLTTVGVADDKIVYIPNGVDLQRFSTAPQFDILEHLGFPPDTFLLASIGNYHPRKGHEVLVDAMAELIDKDPTFRLVIIGAKSDALCAKVEASTVRDHVRFLGSLRVPMPGDARTTSEQKQDVLAAILQKAKAYISSSMNEGAEGLSLALLEAMAAGACPVVTRISGNRDIIEQDRNGVLVEPGDPSALADALLQIKTNPDHRQRMACAAREAVSTYGWSAIADQYLELYRAVIAQPSNPS
ncbi:MAG: glycosyltransferase family 4 protein [Pseudomonadota bacterium]